MLHNMQHPEPWQGQPGCDGSRSLHATVPARTTGYYHHFVFTVLFGAPVRGREAMGNFSTLAPFLDMGP